MVGMTVQMTSRVLLPWIWLAFGFFFLRYRITKNIMVAVMVTRKNTDIPRMTYRDRSTPSTKLDAPDIVSFLSLFEQSGLAER
jgi:hypothetical protein